jgi:hypothetical protein
MNTYGNFLIKYEVVYEVEGTVQETFKGSVKDPGSEFFHPGSRIQGKKDPGSATKNLSIFNPKFVSSRKYDPGHSSWILDPDFPIHLGSHISTKSTGSRIRIRNTV